MAKYNSKGRSRSGPPFTQIFNYMQDSAAWKSLTPLARAAWLEVARFYNGQNNGRIAVSAADLAPRLGVPKASAWRALKELVAMGFIEVVKQGYWKPGDHFREATEYRLTCHRCDVTGTFASKAFLKNFPVSKRASAGFTHETGRCNNTAPGFAHETGGRQNREKPGFTHETHIDIYQEGVRVAEGGRQ